MSGGVDASGSGMAVGSAARFRITLCHGWIGSWAWR